MRLSHLNKLAVVLLLAIGTWAQNPVTAPDYQANTVTFPVFSLNAVPVPGGTIAVVGQPGQATWYFWASANFQLGSVISSLGSITNAPNTLSVSNYVTIYPNAYPAGVTSVDILATTTPLAPTGACNCAVATGLTSGGANFQSNSLSSYTVTLLLPQAYELVLRNEVVGSASTHLLLRNAYTGALVCDLSTACGAGGGTVTGTGTTNRLAVWTSSSAIGAASISATANQVQIGLGGAALVGNNPLTSLGQPSGSCASGTLSTTAPTTLGGCYNQIIFEPGSATGVSAALSLRFDGGNGTTQSGRIGLLSQIEGGSGTITEMRAVDAEVYDNTVATITTRRGLFALSGGVNSSTNNEAMVAATVFGSSVTVGANYGLHVLSPVGSALDTLTANYGIYIEDQTSTDGGHITQTQPHGIYVVAGGIQNGAVAFSTLPACSSSYEGDTRTVSDSTTNVWGATITGTGSDVVGAFCDGTNWTVYAK